LQRAVSSSPPDARSDDELMQLAAADDRAAYEVLVRRHHGSVRAFCARFCGSPSAGDDVAQECFVEVWRRRAAYVARDRFKAYLLHVAANRCKNHLRSRAREQSLKEEQARAASAERERGSDSFVLRRLDRLQAALPQLPEPQREAVLLRFAAQLPYAEIAVAAGIPEATARSRVFLGLMKLRRLVTAKEQS